MIADNGIGFDPEGDFAGHLGLKSIRERMASQGGTIEMTNEKSVGTTKRVSIPAKA